MKTLKLLLILLIVINLKTNAQCNNQCTTGDYSIKGKGKGGQVIARSEPSSSNGGNVDILAGAGSTNGNVNISIQNSTGANYGHINLTAGPVSGNINLNTSSGANPGQISLNGITAVNNTLTISGATVVNNSLTVNDNVSIGTANSASNLHIYGTQSWCLNTDANLSVSNWQLAGPQSVTLNAHNDDQSSHVPMVFSASKFYFHAGNVGIGTTSPLSKLHVQASSGSTSLARFFNNDYSTGVGSGITISTGSATGNTYTSIQAYTAGATTTGNLILNSVGGNVGIGTINPDPNYKVTINGKILAEGVKIKSDISSDFVFENSYKLMKLSEVENFVKTNKHLPEVPSAKEFKETGYNVGTMDDLLLRKVEELTLYIIEQEKFIKSQEERIKTLEEHYCKK